MRMDDHPPFQKFQVGRGSRHDHYGRYVVLVGPRPSEKADEEVEKKFIEDAITEKLKREENANDSQLQRK